MNKPTLQRVNQESPTNTKIALEPAIPARVNPCGQPNGQGKFKLGNPGGPGRPKGSRNKVGNDLKAMIMNAAMRTGFIKIDENGNRIGTGVDGCEGYLMWLCLYVPRTYAGLFARILPYYITSDVLPPVASRAEIEAEFRELGLPMGLIEYLQKAPAPLDDDEDEDPWGLTNQVTPDMASDGTATLQGVNQESSTNTKIALEPAVPARVNPYGQPNGQGKFKPGNPGGPGHPKGSRNKVDIKAMIMNAAMRTGFIKIDENGNRIGTGVDGCEGYLMWLCLYEPRTYAGLFARILPYYITSDVLPPVPSRAEIEAQLKECGLPLDLIERFQKPPAPLDPGEDPDPWGLHKKDATPEEASGTS